MKYWNLSLKMECLTCHPVVAIPSFVSCTFSSVYRDFSHLTTSMLEPSLGFQLQPCGTIRLKAFFMTGGYRILQPSYERHIFPPDIVFECERVYLKTNYHWLLGPESACITKNDRNKFSNTPKSSWLMEITHCNIPVRNSEHTQAYQESIHFGQWTFED